MIKEARGFGQTIDEAKEKAISELGASELDDIQFEVISMPKKKVLGLFGGNSAEVRAFIELPDIKPKSSKAQQPKKAKKETQAKVANEKKQEEKPKNLKPEIVYGEPVDEGDIDKNSPAGKAVEYVKTVLTKIGCNDINIKVALSDNAARILMSGEDLSIVIGRRGETLDSLQYLASLVANNGGGHYRISLNIGDYRERREETLISLAQKIAEQVKRTGKNRTLEPMNPYERRIIHTAIQNIEGVVSNSFGEGTGRRIVVSLEGKEVRPPRTNDRRRNSRNGRSGQNRNRQVSDSPAREPKKDTDIPLYGKIN